MNSSEIPRNEPPEARAGLTWQWRREDLVSDYPASSWTLKYWFKKTGATQANFLDHGNRRRRQLRRQRRCATTGAYTAGDYTWAAIVTGGSTEAYEVDRGRLKLLARYDQAANLDDRTHARKVLDAIEAVIENRATLDQQEYTIGSRHLKRMTAAELVAFREKYRGLVAQEELQERIRNGQGGNRLVVKL
jgi:hypothetical protein